MVDEGTSSPLEGSCLVDCLDHIVLTVASIEESCRFYARALGVGVRTFAHDRKALIFGNQKINLHEHHREFEPKARNPTPGSADICLLSSIPVSSIVNHLESVGVTVEEGPVARTGAVARLISIYFRDPDGNLVEVSNKLASL